MRFETHEATEGLIRQLFELQLAWKDVKSTVSTVPPEKGKKR